MRNKVVSYILPTIGRPAFLEQILNNVKEYITPDDELIIIDGSGNNETQKLVKKYGKLVSKYLRAPEGTSEAYKMNLGILHSTGEIIKPISDDDYLYAKALREAVQILKNDESLDALQCGGEAYRSDKQGNRTFLFYERVPKDIYIGKNFEGLITHNTPHVGLIFKRRILPQIGLYDSTCTSTDVYIMSRMIKTGVAFKYLDLCVYTNTVYSHSTQLQFMKMESDRASIYLSLHDGKNFFHTHWRAISKVFGFTESSKDVGFIVFIVWCYDLLQRRIGKVFFGILGWMKLHFGREQSFEVAASSGVKPKVSWTKKYW